MPKATFDARYENLARICEFVSTVSKEAGLTDADAYSVELATNEACTNIIEYAYGEKNTGTIECSVLVDEQGLTIVLQDHGRIFDVEAVPEVDFSVPLEKLPAGGAGLRIMRGAMDEVKFEPLPVRGNRLTMRKNR